MRGDDLDRDLCFGNLIDTLLTGKTGRDDEPGFLIRTSLGGHGEVNTSLIYCFLKRGQVHLPDLELLKLKWPRLI